MGTFRANQLVIWFNFFPPHPISKPWELVPSAQSHMDRIFFCHLMSERRKKKTFGWMALESNPYCCAITNKPFLRDHGKVFTQRGHVQWMMQNWSSTDNFMQTEYQHTKLRMRLIKILFLIWRNELALRVPVFNPHLRASTGRAVHGCLSIA